LLLRFLPNHNLITNWEGEVIGLVHEIRNKK
jgi:hypothetical protein